MTQAVTRAGAIAGLAAWAGLAVVGPAAGADPTRLITPPAGWRADPEQATALAQRFAATGHFGALRTVTAAEAYVAAQPGAALFVTRATATLSNPPAQAPRATRAALDELRASGRRAALTGGTAQEQGWQERVEADARQVTATLTWTDTTSHAADTARIVVASDGTRIVAVTGECLAGEAAAPALVAACQAALATLDPGVAPASRVAPVLAPEGAAGPEPAAAAPAPGEISASAPRREPARLDDGSRFVMPPTTVALDRPDGDRRPVLVGAGVVVLALMFWWNRRRRDLFEHEDRGASTPRTPRRPRDADDDADDLHAAARAGAPDQPDAPGPPDVSGPPDRADPQARPGKPDASGQPRRRPRKPGSPRKPDRQDR